MLDQLSGELRQHDGELLGLDLWPETRTTLASDGAKGLEVILIVPTDLEASAVTGLSGWMDGIQVVPISATANFRENGGLLSGLPDSAPATALVSADRKLRGEAARAGLYPAPHPSLLPMMMRGETPDAVRLMGTQEVLTRIGLSSDVLPLHFQPVDEKNWALIALVSGDVLTNAALKGVTVNPLAYDPMTHDLIWARIDYDSPEAAAELAKRKILYAEPGQVLLALGPDDDAQAVDIHGAHGHRELLVPSHGLLTPAASDSFNRPTIAPWQIPEGVLEPVPRIVTDPRIIRILLPPCASVTGSYESDLNRYTGVAALDSAGVIVSRHSAHADNKRAEAQLLKDLETIGYCAYRHDFVYAGKTHSNIVADLPGTGTFRIRPEILPRYREILIRNPLPLPLKPFENEMRSELEEHWADAAPLSDTELRYRVEQIFGMRPWYPWWKRLCAIAGIGADLVVVGCHLDSTAGFDPGYVASTSPAPGRDDDGSGVAGVLALARNLWNLRGKLTHTVRFCFFNAEESGLVGSKAYASKMKSLNAPIRAVVCMDMIAHNSDANRIFEIHAGYTDPAIRDLSAPLAAYVENAALAYGQLVPAQVYRGTSSSGGPNRNVYDGAINRSDHAAFHQQGYPAILVSEDFFANLASEPGADPNPNYHRSADTFADLAYARDIVCAVSQAVINLAR